MLMTTKLLHRTKCVICDKPVLVGEHALDGRTGAT
jgi:hypothetical protein